MSMRIINNECFSEANKMKFNFDIKEYQGMNVVYLITNMVSGTQYIGISCNILGRVRQYKRAALSNKDNRYITRAMAKHGLANFSMAIIDTCDDYKLLSNLEIYYIKKYNTKYPFGYNLTDGGSVLTSDTRTKMSNSHKSKKLSDAHKANIAKSHLGVKSWLGKTHTEATKEKMRIKATGRKRPDLLTPETKIRQRQNAIKISKPIQCVETGKIYESINEAARQFNVCNVTLGYDVKHNIKLDGKYSFVYVKVGD